MGIPSGKSTLKRVLKACCITDLFLTVMGLTAAQADTGLYAITYSVTKAGAAYRIVKHSPPFLFPVLFPSGCYGSPQMLRNINQSECLKIYKIYLRKPKICMV